MQTHRSRRFGGLLVALALSAFSLPSVARAAGDDPLPTPTGSPQHAGAPSAEALVNEGLALAGSGEWKAAEAKYRAAAQLMPDLPEAWNGLGHALKNERRYDEALAAYDRALELRPEYPQALEYLGETYVAMGRFKDARKVLARLKPLDRQLAAELESSIVDRTQRAASW